MLTPGTCGSSSRCMSAGRTSSSCSRSTVVPATGVAVVRRPSCVLACTGTGTAGSVWAAVCAGAPVIVRFLALRGLAAFTSMGRMVTCAGAWASTAGGAAFCGCCD